MIHASRLAAATCVGLLLFATSACSSGGSDDAKDATTTTASTGSSADGGETTTADPGTDTTVSQSGPGTVTLADGEAAADKTVMFSTDGGFEPDMLEVAVGELFTFKGSDGDVHAVGFGESTDAYTVMGGLYESFTIDAPGDYTAYEQISSETMIIRVS